MKSELVFDHSPILCIYILLGSLQVQLHHIWSIVYSAILFLVSMASLLLQENTITGIDAENTMQIMTNIFLNCTVLHTSRNFVRIYVYNM